MKDRVNKKRTDNFTTTSNKILQDSRLSYEAIGVFMYLWSMPDDWQVMVKQVMKHNNSSEYKVRQALRELRDFGYMKWTRTQGYFIYDMREDGTFHCGDIQHNKIHYSDNQHNDIYIQNNNINKTITQTKEKDASAFSLSQSNCKENLDSSICKKTLQVQKQNESELKSKMDIQNFVRNYKAQECIVDGILQTTPIFSQNEIDLITEYILRRKEAYKAKVKNTQKALTGVLNDILQVMKEISLETIFEQQEGIYVHCGTAGDKSKPFQTIKLDYFKHLKQIPTFNNQNANTLRQELNSHKQQINSTQIDNYF